MRPGGMEEGRGGETERGVLTGRETLVEALSWRLIYPSESRSPRLYLQRRYILRERRTSPEMQMGACTTCRSGDLERIEGSHHCLEPVD